MVEPEGAARKAKNKAKKKARKQRENNSSVESLTSLADQSEAEKTAGEEEEEAREAPAGAASPKKSRKLVIGAHKEKTGGAESDSLWDYEEEEEDELPRDDGGWEIVRAPRRSTSQTKLSKGGSASGKGAVGGGPLRAQGNPQSIGCESDGSRDPWRKVGGVVLTLWAMNLPLLL